jgi:hypothetical protein
VPAPFDEIVLLLVGAILWLFYRDQLEEAWRAAPRTRSAREALQTDSNR